MNVGGVLLLRFIGSLEQSAEAQAAYAVGYNAALLAHHLDVGRADGRRGDDRRAEPRRRPARAGVERRAASRRASALAVAAVRRRCCSCSCPQPLLGDLRHDRPGRRQLGTQLLRSLASPASSSRWR